MNPSLSNLLRLVTLSLLGACSAVVTQGDGGVDAAVALDRPALDARTDAPAVCTLPGGWRCARGEVCPSPDGCNSCQCGFDGNVQCTLRACVDAGRPGCALPDGQFCPRGQSCPLPDGCNSCFCGSDGVLACTGVVCVDAGRPGCASDVDCDRNTEECVFTVGSCGERGRCVPQSDCANIAPFCGCDGSTFMGCPGRPGRPARREGACEISDAGVPADADCTGAHIGRGGGYCSAPDDGALPVECCTGWNCDTNMALCDSLPPRCPAGLANTVGGGCWGPCVPPTHCAPLRCLGATQCPAGWRCDDANNCIFAPR